MGEVPRADGKALFGDRGDAYEAAEKDCVVGNGGIDSGSQCLGVGKQWIL